MLLSPYMLSQGFAAPKVLVAGIAPKWGVPIPRLLLPNVSRGHQAALAQALVHRRSDFGDKPPLKPQSPALGSSRKSPRRSTSVQSCPNSLGIQEVSSSPSCNSPQQPKRQRPKTRHTSSFCRLIETFCTPISFPLPLPPPPGGERAAGPSFMAPVEVEGVPLKSPRHFVPGG